MRVYDTVVKDGCDSRLTAYFTGYQVIDDDAVGGGT